MELSRGAHERRSTEARNGLGESLRQKPRSRGLTGAPNKEHSSRSTMLTESGAGKYEAHCDECHRASGLFKAANRVAVQATFRSEGWSHPPSRYSLSPWLCPECKEKLKFVSQR